MSLKTRIAWALIALLAAILIPGGFYFLAVSGPKRVDSGAAVTNLEKREPTAEETERIRRLHRDEARFEQLAVLRQPNREDLGILERVIAGYRELEAVLPEPVWDVRDHADRLQERYDGYMGELVFAESRELERSAMLQQDAGELEAARFSFRRAHNLQLRINTDYPRSERYDPGRATRLARQVRFLEAEPSYRESVRLEQDARFAANARDFVRARQLMHRALRLQEAINSDFPSAPQADRFRWNRLRQELRSLQSSELHAQIEGAIARARQLEVDGRHLEAAEAYREAGIKQKALNERFPDSRHASSRKLMEYEAFHQLTLSRERVDGLLESRRELERLLRSRQVHAAEELLARLLPDIRGLIERLPSSRSLLEDVEAELTYLDILGRSLGPIQEQVYGDARPIPGHRAWLMSATEVSQGLYRMIMGANPSLHRGDALPVHGVTPEEARTFCRRLGWVLGLRVRLPGEAEFRAALGSLRYVELEAFYVGGKPADAPPEAVAHLPANPAGFHHLLGNVAEWVGSGADADPVRVMGGRAADSYAALATVPTEERAGDRRWPDVGFRFVLERPSLPAEPVAFRQTRGVPMN